MPSVSYSLDVLYAIYFLCLLPPGLQRRDVLDLYFAPAVVSGEWQDEGVMFNHVRGHWATQVETAAPHDTEAGG